MTWTRRWSLAAVGLLIILSLAALCIGRYTLLPSEVISVLTHASSEASTEKNVVLSIRLPRILGAIFCGGGLAAAGAGFQAVFSNPLATPDTLGVGTAASFGAVFAILLGLPSGMVRLMALAAGILAVVFASAIAKNKGRSSVLMLVLAGMVVSAFFQALTSLVKYVADPQDKLPAITYWLLGSLRSMSWSTFLITALLITAGFALLYALRWKLDAISLGDEEARALGLSVNALRGAAVLASALITAAVVSACGQIGWIGLLIPHMCRMLFGGSNKSIIPASAAAGAIFLLAADTAARSVTAAEIPVALITAVVGAPLFLILLRRTGGSHL